MDPRAWPAGWPAALMVAALASGCLGDLAASEPPGQQPSAGPDGATLRLDHDLRANGTIVFTVQWFSATQGRCGGQWHRFDFSHVVTAANQTTAGTFAAADFRPVRGVAYAPGVAAAGCPDFLVGPGWQANVSVAVPPRPLFEPIEVGFAVRPNASAPSPSEAAGLQPVVGGNGSTSLTVVWAPGPEGRPTLSRHVPGLNGGLRLDGRAQNMDADEPLELAVTILPWSASGHYTQGVVTLVLDESDRPCAYDAASHRRATLVQQLGRGDFAGGPPTLTFDDDVLVPGHSYTVVGQLEGDIPGSATLDMGLWADTLDDQAPLDGGADAVGLVAWEYLGNHDGDAENELQVTVSVVGDNEQRLAWGGQLRADVVDGSGRGSHFRQTYTPAETALNYCEQSLILELPEGAAGTLDLVVSVELASGPTLDLSRRFSHDDPPR